MSEAFTEAGMVDVTDRFTMLGTGMLGAVAPAAQGTAGLKEARLQMIERRILRLEMLLRRAGIEPEHIRLDEIR